MADSTMNVSWPFKSKKKDTSQTNRSLQGITISGPILREDIHIPTRPPIAPRRNRPQPVVAQIPDVSNATADADETDWEETWGVDDDDVPGSPEIDPLSPVSRESVFSNVFKSNKVVPLTSRDFRVYLKEMEKAMVMFYNPTQCECVFPGLELGAAAESCYNENHGFAAVDCSVYSHLCCKEEAWNLPMFKLYSNGYELSTLNDLTNIKADQLKALMTMTPVLTQPRQKYPPRK